jgi:hypothetical protein
VSNPRILFVTPPLGQKVNEEDDDEKKKKKKEKNLYVNEDEIQTKTTNDNETSNQQTNIAPRPALYTPENPYLNVIVLMGSGILLLRETCARASVVFALGC